MSALRLEDLLRTGELFFAHLPSLEDCREGKLTVRSSEHLANWFEAHQRCSRIQAFAAVDRYLENQQQFYVNCWHMNDHESYLMWKAYAQRGYAIQTTFERVQSAFDETACVVTGGVIQYVDFERDVTPVGNVFNHVATKDMPYRDEREFRLVFWQAEQRNQAIPLLANGVRVAVNIRMLVSAIVVSPFAKAMSPAMEQLIDASGVRLVGSSVTPKITR